MSCISEAVEPRAHLSGADVDAHLRRSIRELHNAEHSVFLWFCEIERRSLYRELGYGSIHAYGAEELGFTLNRICRYLHLMDDLERLPAIRAALDAGRIGWTKARVIVRVASAENEGAWLEAALRLSRRELEAKIAEAQAERKRDTRQPELVACQAPPRATPRKAAPQGASATEAPVFRPRDEELTYEGKSALIFRLAATDLARYEALIEKLHKQGRIAPGTPKEAILLHALAAWTESKAPVPRGTGATNVQIHIQKDEASGTAVVQTQPGPRKLSRAELEAAECDAVITEPGKRNRSAIPPSVRRAVLERDGYRCQAPGCKNTHFLEIHHIVPRKNGGTHDPKGLLAICSSCHRLLHERELDGELFRQSSRGLTQSG